MHRDLSVDTFRRSNNTTQHNLFKIPIQSSIWHVDILLCFSRPKDSTAVSTRQWLMRRPLHPGFLTPNPSQLQNRLVSDNWRRNRYCNCVKLYIISINDSVLLYLYPTASNYVNQTSFCDSQTPNLRLEAQDLGQNRIGVQATFSVRCILFWFLSNFPVWHVYWSTPSV